MENVQSHTTSNPTSISQYAAEAALTGDQSCIEPMATAMALCDYLLAQPQAVAAVPGSAFGAEGYLRISFATSMENIRKAVERMASAMAPAQVAA